MRNIETFAVIGGDLRSAYLAGLLAADILLLSLERYRGKIPLFLGIDRVTFLQKIVPGDTIEILSLIHIS